MNKVKLLKIVSIVNVVLIVCFAPIMLFIGMFALKDIMNAHFSGQMVIIGIGYLVAAMAGIFALKKPQLLIVSLFGWGILWWGQSIYEDRIGQKREQEQLCQLLRQNSECTEDRYGIVSCAGSLAGTTADCKGIPK